MIKLKPTLIATAFCNVHRAPPCTDVHLYIARGTQAQKGLAASQWYLVSHQQILPTEGITSHLKGMFNAVIDFPGKKMQSISSKNIKRSHSAVVKARTRSSAYFYFCLSFFCWCEKIDCALCRIIPYLTMACNPCFTAKRSCRLNVLGRTISIYLEGQYRKRATTSDSHRWCLKQSSHGRGYRRLPSSTLNILKSGNTRISLGDPW